MPGYFSFLFDQDEDEEEMRKKSRRRRIREKISLDLADVASSYGLVRFQPLVVTDERLIRNVILQVYYFIIIYCKSIDKHMIYRQIKQLD